ncbi:hypothetical protein ES692_11405 [Psychroserpens burtonensis]|uniref:Lipocalin-like domain-containing protein n=1 Tax=Psychroserpens burtonensis TaxID=49278 RepID=A0A5C7B6I3_9FLAO|nr:DUF6252 family protein [Psychroserpens burtonensis]TXE16950.1 hypothetical protein ES692_11405 [Psychroserpens burtonensis]
MNILKRISSKTALILCSLTVVLSSCSSGDDSSDSEQSDYYLTAKIDGVDYSREFVTVSASADNTDIYVITAIGETSSIALTLEGPISTGTFTTATGTFPVMFYQQNDPFVAWGATEDGGSGTITITESTATYLKGTFSFTGVNPADDSTKLIAEGRFKAQKL